MLAPPAAEGEFLGLDVWVDTNDSSLRKLAFQIQGDFSIEEVRRTQPQNWEPCLE